MTTILRTPSRRRKGTTKTHPNQLLDTQISQIILSNTRQSDALPYIQVIRKAAKLHNKNSSLKTALLIPKESTNAIQSTMSPPIAQLHVSGHKPYTTHNSSTRSGKGLEILYGAQFTLSTYLIKPNYLVILVPHRHNTKVSCTCK